MKRVLEIVAVILALSVLRLFIHIPGIHPIGAIALFGGAMIANKKLSLLLPFSVLMISDLALTKMSAAHAEYIGSISMIAVYLAFLGMVFIGQYYISKNRNFKGILIGTSFSTLLFFILSNLGAWVYDPMYAKTLDGAIAALANGLPFLQYDALSIIGVTGFVFGLYSIYERFAVSRAVKSHI